VTAPSTVFRASMLDLIIDAVGRRTVPFQLWGFWDFDRRIDHDRLRDATSRLVSRVPPLGCRLVEGFFRAAFEPVPGLDTRDLAARREVADEAEVDAIAGDIVDSFLDVNRGPAMRVHQIDWSGGTRLVLHLHHCLADGRGTVRVMDELAGCYRHPDPRDDPRPPAPFDHGRGIGQILGGLGPASWLRMPAVLFREQIMRSFRMRRLGSFAHLGAGPTGESRGTSGAARHGTIRLDRAALARVRERCESLGATVNDYLMSGAIAAIAAWRRRLGTPERALVPMVFASDLRERYRPDAAPFANLSAVHSFWVPAREVGSLEETLLGVKRRIDGMKRRGLGLDGVLAASLASVLPARLGMALMGPAIRMMARTIRVMNGMTNIGILPDAVGSFGDGLEARACSILAPVFTAATTLFTVTTYRGALTLHMGYDRNGMSDEDAGRFRETLSDMLDPATRA